jgi:hypothetical protein
MKATITIQHPAGMEFSAPAAHPKINELVAFMLQECADLDAWFYEI